MPPKKSKSSASKSAKPADGFESKAVRLWLMYPPGLIRKPTVWEMGHKFKVITNVRQASVTDEIGIVCLEIDGDPAEIKRAIAWLEKQGISVEPVEINVIES